MTILASQLEVGDAVVATRDIWQDADEDHPRSLYASRGDQLEVRRGKSEFWFCYVAHPHREPTAMFGVNEDEISAPV